MLLEKLIISSVQKDHQAPLVRETLNASFCSLVAVFFSILSAKGERLKEDKRFLWSLMRCNNVLSKLVIIIYPLRTDKVVKL